MQQVGQERSPSTAGKGRRQDLSGKRFGLLTALEYDCVQKKWKCRCDCGNTVYKTTGHLNADSVSCGCSKNKDLAGKRFGKLTVLKITEQKSGGSRLWLCRCDCGTECLKPTNQLNSGFATSCGCSWRQSAVREKQQYGRLTALRPTPRRSAGSVVWECACQCGNTVFVRATMLASGHTTSCGCAKRELDREKDFKKILTYTDGTCIEFARGIGKKRANTSQDTGVRGVVLKDGKYVAQIKFRKQRYYLGRFDRLEDAAAARRRAEARVEEYVEDYLAGNLAPSVTFDL